MKIAAKSRADSVQTDRSRTFGSTTSLVLTDFALGATFRIRKFGSEMRQTKGAAA